MRGTGWIDPGPRVREHAAPNLVWGVPGLSGSGLSGPGVAVSGHEWGD
ncbi:hypothetical protein FHS42_002934 [Streptomyces zagrosensis]|uniref:Uncharacterized protein n=1 Tax=Streptomyces zagrosensis TaxID=1042984 RepID=A0A7W9UYE2_9ACTN|nr:hypothetical protein [Streptomyces zagrosensis]